MTKGVVVVTSLLFAWPVLASDDWYSRKSQQLKSDQDHSDALIHRLQVQSGIIGSPPPKAKDDTEKSPLFQVHDDLSAKLPAGKLLYGKVFNRLIVGSDGSPVLIELDSGQGRYSNLRLMGFARQSGTPGRLTVEVQRLLLSNGRAVNLQASALDTDGAFGLEAQVFSSKALALTGALASSFIAGAAASQQTESTNAFGFSQIQPTGRNAIFQGLAQSAADQSKRLIGDATSEKPVLVVESQTSVTVLVQEEVRF